MGRRSGDVGHSCMGAMGTCYGCTRVIKLDASRVERCDKGGRTYLVLEMQAPLSKSLIPFRMRRHPASEETDGIC